jgi:hypothetical protein
VAPQAYITALERVIFELHACASQHLETVHVKEDVAGKLGCEGDVEVFGLIGHRRATRCYAWVPERGAKDEHTRFFAVLENTVIRTPLDAIKFVRVAHSAELINEFSRVLEHL